MKRRLLTVTILEEDYRQLEAISEDEERVPGEQASYFIRQALRVMRPACEACGAAPAARAAAADQEPRDAS